MPELSSLTARALAILTLIVASPSPPPLDAAEPDSATAFKKEVLPILKAHCVRCHGPDKQESRIRLDNLSTDLVQNRAAAENWNEVLHVLNAGEMPPEDEPQLSVLQNKVLTNWISTAIRRAIEAGRATDGRAVLRRLNRTEYQNTMSDLLGLEMDYARDLPPDPAAGLGADWPANTVAECGTHRPALMGPHHPTQPGPDHPGTDPLPDPGAFYRAGGGPD